MRAGKVTILNLEATQGAAGPFALANALKAMGISLGASELKIIGLGVTSPTLLAINSQVAAPRL